HCIVVLVSRFLCQLANRLHTCIDRNPAGVQYNVVEGCITPIDVEQGPHRTCASRIESLDLPTYCSDVLDTQTIHDDAFAHRHRCTYPHADDLRYVAKQCGCPPSANQHIALLG